MDDEADSRIALTLLLKKDGFHAIACQSGEEALRMLQNADFDLVLTDMNMPGMDGIALLKTIKSLYPQIPVILLTGYATIETAVVATKEGAEDYITKPCTGEELRRVIGRVLRTKALLEENRTLQSKLDNRFQLGNIIGTSSEMQEIYRLIEKAGSSKANVIIYGETGTGKELVAKAIHFASDRTDNPLVSINCGAIPDNLLESELFGAMKGAYTGAIKDKAGLFEEAGVGSIFLDEIGDMPLSIQVKLLRVLEEREFRRLGETKSRRMNARVIAATHRNLTEMVEDGNFREDLYYRLHIIPIYLPPLRAKKSDIPLLAKHFLELFHEDEGKPSMEFSDKAIECLINYDWPGNVRELVNLVRQLIALEDAPVISHLMLPVQFRSKPELSKASSKSFRPLAEVEKDYIDMVLEAVPNKTAAASILGIDRKTLYTKIKQHKPD